MKFNYFSFVPKKLFVACIPIIPARLNITVKKNLIIILFSSIPEARYEINIIKNSIESSPSEKLTGKVETFPMAEASACPPVQGSCASSYRPEPLPKYSPVNRLQNYSIIFYEDCQEILFIFRIFLIIYIFFLLFISEYDIIFLKIRKIAMNHLD